MIEYDQNSGERLYKRIRANFKRLYNTRKKIRALEQSKFGKYLNKNPKMVMILNLGVLFFGEPGPLDDYLNS